jgi:hypothetical protein
MLGIMGFLMLMTAKNVSWSQEEAESPSLGVTADMTLATKYLWYGYDPFDDHGAYQPSINWDILDTGFSVNVWGSFPFGSGNEVFKELDYSVAYGTTIFEEETYALDLGANYIYYDFPRVGSRFVPDSHEVGVSAALPNLIKIGDSALVPSYHGAKFWPADSGLGFDVSGGIHTLGLDYDFTIPNTDQVLSLSADLNYNDGLFAADHDWSHATLGISTSFEVGPVSLTPFLNYQISMDDSVNPVDEFWGGLSVSMSF